MESLDFVYELGIYLPFAYATGHSRADVPTNKTHFVGVLLASLPLLGK